jgi:23S rRNA (uracil1939-C5)-methyltransferase
VALVESGIIRIGRLNENGRGEAEGQSFCFPYTLPGEEISYEKHTYRGKDEYVLKEILRKSEERVTPECKYHGVCGGCSLGHLSKNFYKEFKQQLAEDLLEKLGLLLPAEVIHLENPKRRRINLVFSKRKNQFHLGFYKLSSNKIIDIDLCTRAEDDLSNAIKDLRDKINIFAKEIDFLEGEIHLLKASNGILVTISFDHSINIDYPSINRQFKAFTTLNNQIYLEVFVKGNLAYKWQKNQPVINFASLDVQALPRNFYQPTQESDYVISDIILGFLSSGLEDKKCKIADLFCGSGTYTIPMLIKGYEVIAFEDDIPSLNMLKDAAKDNNLDLQLNARDLYSNPLSKDELSNFDVVVLNPPRTGAEAICNNLSSGAMQQIIYVSCSFESFKRDYQLICKNYSLGKIKFLDQFYHTHHMEIIAQFTRK